MLSSDYHCKEHDGFLIVPVHPELITSDYGVHEVGVTVCGVQHVRHFPYNQNPTRALKTISLKCCLPSTDAIDRWEKNLACI